MIVKFIAENDAEKKRLGDKDELEHSGVKEYFVIGNKTDTEGSVYDFHDWHGAFKFLLSELNYYYETINDERRAAGTSDGEEIPIRDFAKKQHMIRKGDVGKIHPIDLSNLLDGSKKLPTNVGDDEALEAEGAHNFPEFRIMNENEERQVHQPQQVETTVDEINKLGKRGLRIVPPSIE